MEKIVNLNCRFYENEMPEKDDFVMVEIVSVDTLGSTVKLTEYNNIEGFVPSSEYSRTRVRSVARLMKVGLTDVLQVTGVDSENGYIDLSKKFVTAEDKENQTKKFKQSLQVHNILKRLAEIFHKDLEQLYKEFGWELYKDHGHAINAFNLALENPSVLDKYNIQPPQLKEKLIETIKHRLTTKALKYEAEIDLTCFSFEGVDAIKAALKEGLKVNESLEKELALQANQPEPEEEEEEAEENAETTQSTSQKQKDGKKEKKGKKGKDDKKKKKKKDKKGPPPGIVTITLSASPTYSLSIVHPEKDIAVAKLNETIELIKKSIESFNGRIEVKVPPRVITKI